VTSSGFVVGVHQGWAKKYFAAATTAVLLTVQYGRATDESVLLVPGEFRVGDGVLLPRHCNHSAPVPEPVRLAAVSKEFDCVLVHQPDSQLVSVVAALGVLG